MLKLVRLMAVVVNDGFLINGRRSQRRLLNLKNCQINGLSFKTSTNNWSSL